MHCPADVQGLFDDDDEDDTKLKKLKEPHSVMMMTVSDLALSLRSLRSQRGIVPVMEELRKKAIVRVKETKKG